MTDDPRPPRPPAVGIMPVLMAIGEDADLTSSAAKIYLYLLPRLSGDRPMPVKVWAAAEVLGLSHVTVRRGLAALVERGYLAAGPHEGKIGTYRLRWERAA